MALTGAQLLFSPQWDANEAQLYQDYSLNQPYSSPTAFGEAKGININNSFYGALGPTGLPSFLDTAISIPQTGVATAMEGLWQLGTEAGKAINQGNFFSTDWLSKAGQDFREQMTGYLAGRYGGQDISNNQAIWNLANLVDTQQAGNIFQQSPVDYSIPLTADDALNKSQYEAELAINPDFNGGLPWTGVGYVGQQTSELPALQWSDASQSWVPASAINPADDYTSSLPIQDFWNPTTGETFRGTGETLPENQGWMLGSPDNTQENSMALGNSIIGTPFTPATNEYGFTGPTGATSMALVDWYNPDTGESWTAGSGGWTPPANSSWTNVRPDNWTGENPSYLAQDTEKLSAVTTPGVSNNAGQTIYGGSDGTTPVGTYDSYGMPLMGTAPTTGGMGNILGLFNGNTDWLQNMFGSREEGYTLQQTQQQQPNPNPIWGAPSYYRPEPEAWWQKPIPGFGDYNVGQGQTPWWQSNYGNLPAYTNPTTGQTEPTPGTQVPIDTTGVSDSTWDAGSDFGFEDPTQEDIRNYLENRDLYQGMFKGLGTILGGSVVGKLLGGLADYNYGINTVIPGQPTFTDRYTALGGPGSSGEYTGGVMTPSEQRDALILQTAFTEEEPGMFSNLFGGLFGTQGGAQQFDFEDYFYDPEMDLSIGEYLQTTPLTLDAMKSLGWTNNYLEGGFTQDDVDFIESGFNEEGYLSPSYVEDLMAAGYTTDDINFIQSGFDEGSRTVEESVQQITNPQSVEEALEVGKPFGQQGDDTWTDGTNVWHGSGYDWNNDGGGSGSSEEAGSASDSNMSEAGFSQADQDFIDSGFDDSSSGGGDGGGGGGGSYIATATTQALGEDGLKVFEDWRDYMAKVYPTFKASYGRYRVTAPKIVTEIDKKDNSKNIYSWIWDMHLKPIFDLISKDKDSKKAQKDYKIMVRQLSKKFLKKEKTNGLV